MNDSLSGERAGVGPAKADIGGLRVRFLPSLSDCLFIVLILVLFAGGYGWMTLLVDGDTGLHIRTGDFILASHAVPVHDPFTYSAPEKPWFAWEWLSDVVFALVWRLAGLKGIVLLSGSVVCMAITILFRHMIWRNAGVHIALGVSLLVAGALRFHMLARPHIFTTLLTVVTQWMLDRDREKPGKTVWLLVPTAILWVNLHGGFLVLILSLGAYTAAALLARHRQRAWRYGSLMAACTGATLLNPYGWRLHQHLWGYLRSDWLVKSIDEFKSPEFRSDAMFMFEILMFLGLIFVVKLIYARQYPDVLLILSWAHAALLSVRHVTIYAIVSGPPVAQQLESLWDRWTVLEPRGSLLGAARDLVRDLKPRAMQTSVWGAVFVGILAFTDFGGKWPSDFPGVRFPADLVTRNASLLSGRPGIRILSPDFWGGYLTYRLYPCQCVFIDGRSDYFGSKTLGEYATLRSAGENWQGLMDGYRFQFVLIPREWPLTSALRKHPDWVLRDQERDDMLFERRQAAIPPVQTDVYNRRSFVEPRATSDP
jgi:hypothetical protein